LKPYGTVQGFDYVNSDLASPLSEVYGATTSEGIVDRAIRWIEGQGDGRWFVFAHFMEPHSTYLPHEGIPDFGNDRNGLYDGEVYFADRAIGRLLERMKELGLDRDMAVVAMGDHGEMLGAHGQQSHGTSMWQEVLKVPIIVAAPGLEPRVSPCVTSHADVAPTILNLVGIDGGQHGMTTSTLVPDLVGTCDPEREIVSELRDLRAVVGPEYKLMYNTTSRTQELYDVVADPQERQDLFAAQPVRAKQMFDRLMAWEENLAGAQISEVMHRAIVDEVPSRAKRVYARFDVGVDLLAVDMGSRRLTTNEALRIAIYLRAVRRIPPSCRIRVELNAGGQRVRVRGRGQHKPVGGALPFELFPLNRIVEDVFHLAWRSQAGRTRGALAIQCGSERSAMESNPPGMSRTWFDLGEIEIVEIKPGDRSGP
jgi:hypothetical protein